MHIFASAMLNKLMTVSWQNVSEKCWFWDILNTLTRVYFEAEKNSFQAAPKSVRGVARNLSARRLRPVTESEHKLRSNIKNG